MVQQDWSSLLQPACLSQITIMGLDPRVQQDVAGRSQNFLVDTGATYSVLTTYSRAFSSQTCIILGATGKTITKDSPGHFFAADKYFPTSFWWSLSVLLLYWEETHLCLWNLAAIAVQIEDALKLFLGGKLTIFTGHQVKQLLNGWGHLWISDQRILKYQVVLMENPGLTISPSETLNPVTLLPTLECSLPFHSCLETLDHWTKPKRDCWKILWPILRKSGTFMEAALSWMEKEEPDRQ